MVLSALTGHKSSCSMLSGAAVCGSLIIAATTDTQVTAEQ